MNRDIAAGKPGMICHVGLATIVDPRQAGGRISGNSEGIVEVVEPAGEEWLFLKAFPDPRGASARDDR